MIRRTFGLATLLALAVALPAQAQVVLTRPEDVGMSSQKLAMLHDALKLHIDVGQIPGGIVLVAREGKVVYFEAQGASSRNGTPLTTESIAQLASLSKPITAVAILMLVDEGKVKLDDPLGKYIPEYAAPQKVRVLQPGSPPLPYSALPFVIPFESPFGAASTTLVPAEKPVTIRMLLTHTSGVQVFGVPNDMPQPKPGEKLADVIPKFAATPLEFQPGSRWIYSNGAGFDILGRVVEVASGLAFDQFLKQRLFEPLGMKDTGFGTRREAFSRVATMFPGMKPQAPEDVTYFSGAAGISSTMGDYSHFAQMLLDGGKANGREFLKPETVKMMSANQIGPLVMGGYPPMSLAAEGLKFGFGVLNVTHPNGAGTLMPAGSWGWDGVGSRRFWVVPDQRIVIVMMAAGVGPLAAPLHRDVEAIVMSSIIPKP